MSIDTDDIVLLPPEVDPRIAARRREVAEGVRRRRRRRTTVVGVVAVVLTAAYALSRTPLLDVDAIEVAGAPRTGPEAVRSAAGVEPGDQLVDVDVDAVAAAVESLPWVAEASIHRSPWGTVRIDVRERTPVATALDESGATMLVDGDGHVLAPGPDPASAAELAVLHGVPAPEPGGELDDAADAALDLVGELGPGLQARVSEVHVGPEGHLDVALRPQGTVVLGPPTQLEEKLTSLVTVLSQVDQDRLESINLTVPDLPAVTRW